jgi:hypothetical protein
VSINDVWNVVSKSVLLMMANIMKLMQLPVSFSNNMQWSNQHKTPDRLPQNLCLINAGCKHNRRKHRKRKQNAKFEVQDF